MQNLTVWRLVSDVHVRISRLFSQRGSELGLTRPLWQALAVIYREPGCTQTELAHGLSMGRSPLGKAIDKLEGMGLVERRPDPDDRRVNRLYLTPAADQYLEPGQQVVANIEASMLETLTAQERQVLIRALERIRQTLGDQLQAEDVAIDAQ